jgi:hypothetical protein
MRLKSTVWNKTNSKTLWFLSIQWEWTSDNQRMIKLHVWRMLERKLLRRRELKVLLEPTSKHVLRLLVLRLIWTQQSSQACLEKLLNIATLKVTREVIRAWLIHRLVESLLLNQRLNLKRCRIIVGLWISLSWTLAWTWIWTELWITLAPPLLLAWTEPSTTLVWEWIDWSLELVHPLRVHTKAPIRLYQTETK